LFVFIDECSFDTSVLFLEQISFGHKCSLNDYILLGPGLKCSPGKKFVVDENGNAGKCEACPSGTFNSNDDSSTECTKHNPCADTTVKEAGTASKDVVCNPGMFSYTHMKHRCELLVLDM